MGWKDFLDDPFGTVGDAVADVASDIVTADNTLGAITRQMVGSDRTTWADQRQATEDAEAQRQELGLSSDVCRLDSTLVMDNFDAMTHEEMLVRTDAISAEAIDAAARAWSGVSERTTPAVETFRQTIASAIGSGWDGLAAERASGRVSIASGDLGKLSDEAADVARQLEVAQVGFHEAQRKMPPTKDGLGFTEVLLNPLSAGASVIKGDQYEKSERREEALVILKGVYAPTAFQTDTGSSALQFTTGTTITGGEGADSNTWAGRDGAGTWIGGDGTTPPGVNGNNVPTGVDQRSGDGSDDIPAGAGNGAAFDQSTATGGDSDAQAKPTSNAVDNAWTAPASASGNATGPAGAYGPSVGSGYGAGPGSGAGGSGYGAGGFGGGAGAGGVPGGFVAGGVGASAGMGASPASSPGTAGRPGAPGMGMAPPAARGGGGGGDDAEHTTPGYLVNADNGNELVGSLPLVAPPVFGA